MQFWDDSYSDLRKEYSKGTLAFSDCEKNPLELIQEWIEHAIFEGIPEANAACLASVSKDLRPRTRIVLLKGIEKGLPVFFTNEESVKGQHFSHNTAFAATLWWRPLQRQICMDGTVEQLPRDIVESYFQKRERGSQISAWVSRQSKEIGSRKQLENEYQRCEKEWEGKDIAAPKYWKGYCLNPERVEFWQGREHRLHDRIEFKREGNTWVSKRLYP